MQGETIVSSTNESDEMVLPCADCAFGGIATMLVGWNELEVNLFLVHVTFEKGRTLVVEKDKLRFEPCTVKSFDNSAVGFVNVRGLARGKRFREDVIAVVIINNKDIFVASA